MKVVNNLPVFFPSSFSAHSQHYLTAFGSTLSVPLVLAGPLCMTYDPVAVSQLVGTIFFVGGIATLMQTTFGIRSVVDQVSGMSW